MFPSRNEIRATFQDPSLIQHPLYAKGIQTFTCLKDWSDFPAIELPKFRIQVLGLDYLDYSSSNSQPLTSIPAIRFQQDCFRLWFQVDGNGILQNLSKNSFGSARPGLLGIMERSQRYAYLHQRGDFQCFQVLFSLLPSHQAKCFWHSAVEGKTVLEGTERSYFETLVFDLLALLSNRKDVWGLSTASRLLEIFVMLFKSGLLSIEESQFPKNKVKSLTAKAKAFLELNYPRMRHQNELEKECGIDINYLNIIFKKETGLTLYDYLTGIRMEQAKYLLETTADPVSSIALRVGYPNGNSFTRAFTRREKCAPLAYRVNYRGAPAA